jgi:hypothetical protein
MKDYLKEVISKQRYEQLSLDEKESLNELCLDENSSEAIGAIFSVLDGLNVNSTIQPRNQTKEHLDHLFQSSTQARGSSFSMVTLAAFFFPPTKSLWQSPLIPLAAVVVLLFIGVRFWTEDINDVNAIGLKTAQLNDVKQPTWKNKQTQTSQHSGNTKANHLNEKVQNTAPVTNTLMADDMPMDTYPSVDSDASGDLDGLAMKVGESIADKKELVSFRLADCPECMELITASY